MCTVVSSHLNLLQPYQCTSVQPSSSFLLSMASSDGTACGGYDYSFVDGDPPDEYQCHICKLVARGPQQVTCCYKIYCKSCLDTLKEKGHQFNCPTCRSPLRGAYFEDGRAEQGIKSLKVYCTNTDSGCQWMGTIGDAHTHINSCTYQLVPCTKGCDEEIRRGTLETHLTETCPKRIVNCQYCKRKGAHKLITSKSHLDECPDLPITCGECNQTMPQRLHNETCPKAMISCVGCNIVLKREDLEKHNEELMKEHLDIAMKKIDALQHSSNQKVFMLPGYTKKKEADDDWCSPYFYTSPGGYKMLLCVFPNGDECSKGTHVSCFIHLKAGEYDDRLEWPFQGEVTIELLNQVEDKNHKKETVLYDESTEDKYKQRDSTVGWGWPGFISHSALEYDATENCQYLKDDSLYFRVSVKVTSKTKPWLVTSVDS